LQHELDGAARAWWGSVLLEAKAYDAGSPSKSDVCIFDRKTFDYLLARHEAGAIGPHWRVLASASPVDAAVRAYCHLHGIVVTDPELLPLPLLLRYAAGDEADRWADPMLWSELVRLAERAVVPFEARYVPTPEGLLFQTRWLPRRDLDDLLFVQAALTGQIFESVDENQPEFFAERSVEVLRTVGGTAPGETAAAPRRLSCTSQLRPSSARERDVGWQGGTHGAERRAVPNESSF
jgi:hypothetical protein